MIVLSLIACSALHNFDLKFRRVKKSIKENRCHTQHTYVSDNGFSQIPSGFLVYFLELDGTSSFASLQARLGVFAQNRT